MTAVERLNIITRLGSRAKQCFVVSKLTFKKTLNKKTMLFEIAANQGQLLITSPLLFWISWQGQKCRAVQRIREPMCLTIDRRKKKDKTGALQLLRRRILMIGIKRRDLLSGSHQRQLTLFFRLLTHPSVLLNKHNHLNKKKYYFSVYLPWKYKTVIHKITKPMFATWFNFLILNTTLHD